MIQEKIESGSSSVPAIEAGGSATSFARVIAGASEARKYGQERRLLADGAKEQMGAAAAVASTSGVAVDDAKSFERTASNLVVKTEPDEIQLTRIPTPDDVVTTAATDETAASTTTTIANSVGDFARESSIDARPADVDDTTALPEASTAPPSSPRAAASSTSTPVNTSAVSPRSTVDGCTAAKTEAPVDRTSVSGALGKGAATGSDAATVPRPTTPRVGGTTLATEKGAHRPLDRSASTPSRPGLACEKDVGQKLAPRASLAKSEGSSSVFTDERSATGASQAGAAEALMGGVELPLFLSSNASRSGEADTSAVRDTAAAFYSGVASSHGNGKDGCDALSVADGNGEEKPAVLARSKRPAPAGNRETRAVDGAGVEEVDGLEPNAKR